MIVYTHQRLVASRVRRELFSAAAHKSSSPLLLRWHSSIEANQCPYNHAGKKNDSVKTANNVDFVDVPKLPLFGSIIPQHSGMVKYDFSTSYDCWYGNYETFGDFYSAGLPGIGRGLYNEGTQAIFHSQLFFPR